MLLNSENQAEERSEKSREIIKPIDQRFLRHPVGFIYLLNNDNYYSWLVDQQSNPTLYVTSSIIDYDQINTLT